MEIFRGPPQIFFYPGNDWWIFLIYSAAVALSLRVIDKEKAWTKLILGGLFASFSLILAMILHESGHAVAALSLGGSIQKIEVHAMGAIITSLIKETPSYLLFLNCAGWVAAYTFAFLIALFARGERNLFWRKVLFYSSLLILINEVPVIWVPFEGVPSDGFRILVTILWWLEGDRLKATEIVMRHLPLLERLSAVVVVALVPIFARILRTIIPGTSAVKAISADDL